MIAARGKSFDSSKRKKYSLIRENPHRALGGSISRSHAGPGEWDDTCKVLKAQKLPTKILYPAKLSFRSEGEVHAFPTNNVREFITTSLALLEMLQGVLQAVTKGY